MATRVGGLIRKVAVCLLSVAVPTGLVWLAIALYPDQLANPANPDFVDSIFDSQGVIWAARLLLVSAAFVLALGGVFIVVSTVIRMRNGEWLKRAGPFEISETVVTDLEDEIELWRKAALNDREEIVDLRQQLGISNELIERYRSRRRHG